MSTEEPRPAPRSLDARDPERTLIDDYLAEQQKLQTPVRRFADAHDAGAVQEKWRDLIPLTAPGIGEQYAFEVDLDRCTGCKACVAGCHSLNGLEDEETWRDVGLLLGGTRSQPYQQTVTTACHHCADPACLNGCPVLAYEKDPVTGVVRHLDDQCIGCQYCVLKCPYDVPKYSERLGIVRKCDMCHHRLSAGEAPACVQACPTEAIRIVTVVAAAAPVSPALPSTFLPEAPSPAYTRPTTRYLSKRPRPDDARAADFALPRLQPAHWPLVFMLTLLGLAVGASGFAVARGVESHLLENLAWCAGLLGLGASVLHLGKPLRAWRVFLGLRRSWLSREAVLFGLWFGGASLILTLRWLAPAAPGLRFFSRANVALGCAGLVCSAMIYVDTQRRLWRAAQSFPRFLGTAVVLGGALDYAVTAAPFPAVIAAVALLIKLGVEARLVRALDLDVDEPGPDQLSAALLVGPLRLPLAVRCLGAGAVVFGWTASLLTGATESSALRWGLLGMALLSELIERSLFFRAVFAPKMPGLPKA